jgi:hypothetical protein
MTEAHQREFFDFRYERPNPSLGYLDPGGREEVPAS